MEERLKKNYTRRLRMILKSELNTKTKIQQLEKYLFQYYDTVLVSLINDKNLQEN